MSNNSTKPASPVVTQNFASTKVELNSGAFVQTYVLTKPSREALRVSPQAFAMAIASAKKK